MGRKTTVLQIVRKWIISSGWTNVRTLSTVHSNYRHGPTREFAVDHDQPTATVDCQKRRVGGMQTGIRRPCRGSISTPGRRVWTGSGQRRLTISPEMVDSRRSSLRFIRGDSVRSTEKTSRIRVVPKNHALHAGPDPLWEGAIFGERRVHCKVLSTVSCAKMAETIEMQCAL